MNRCEPGTARALAVLARRGAASQADIVRETGLSRTTVSSLVADLLSEGVVVERPDSERQAPSPSGGRPATLLSLEPSSGGFIGIDFGREVVRVAIADRAGDLILDARSDRLEVAHQAEQALALAEAMVADALDQADIEPDRVLRAGVAVSAPVRSDHPGFASGVIFPSWAKINVAGHLGERPGVPVHVGNDANLGALAEATFGAGRGKRDLFYVMLSEGIGGGVIVDGRIYQGGAGAAGEAVGRVLASTCATLDPELVIIGGELAPAGQPLLHSIQTTLEKWISPASGHYPVTLGQLGAKAEVLGAIANAMSHTTDQTLTPH